MKSSPLRQPGRNSYLAKISSFGSTMFCILSCYNVIYRSVCAIVYCIININIYSLPIAEIHTYRSIHLNLRTEWAVTSRRTTWVVNKMRDEWPNQNGQAINCTRYWYWRDLRADVVTYTQMNHSLSLIRKFWSLYLFVLYFISLVNFWLLSTYLCLVL